MANLNLETLWYERERQELLRAYEAIHGKIDGRIIPHDLPRPKLSDVLRCAQLAKVEPEIWELAKKEAFFTDEQFEHREHMLWMFLRPFTDWFRLKNGLYDHDDWAFALSSVLCEWTRPDFGGDEVATLRRLIFPNRYVDDLANGASKQGDKP